MPAAQVESQTPGEGGNGLYYKEYLSAIEERFDVLGQMMGVIAEQVKKMSEHLNQESMHHLSFDEELSKTFDERIAKIIASLSELSAQVRESSEKQAAWEVAMEERLRALESAYERLKEEEEKPSGYAAFRSAAARLRARNETLLALIRGENSRPAAPQEDDDQRD